MKKKFLIFIISLFMPIQILAYSNKLVLGGDNVGISLKSDGVLVVGFYKINGNYPLSKLNIGDYITKVGDTQVNSLDDLISEIEKQVSDNSIEIEYRHNNELKYTKLYLEEVNGVYKTGLYVKDGLKGVGTLTYIDPESKIYGCLGHEVLESTTNTRLEISSGSIFKSKVTSITKSENGNPGTKNAEFYPSTVYGSVLKNISEGVYGEYSGDIDDDNLIEIANVDDVRKGDAFIYTSLDDNNVKPYKINLLRIEKNSKMKNFYFEVVDKELLDKTGGIIQGMSGSPIVQDNKLIGAVTHVSVDSVKNGYGISIVNMLEKGEE